MSDIATERLLDMAKKQVGLNSWSESGTATNATATATRAATTGERHALHTIIVDYDDSAADRDVIVKFGGTEQFRYHVSDKRILTLPIPLQAGTGEAVSVEAATGGSGIEGRVTIIGITLDV